MKKIILLLLVIITISCSKDAPVTVVIPPTSFTVTADPNRTMNNLVVNDRIGYTVKIENFDTNPNVYYVLKPKMGNATKHQINGTDFYFQTRYESGGGLFPSVSYDNVNEITIRSAESRFYILIARPGNFQHQYILQKMNLDTKENEPAVQDVLFNAVKIRAWSTTQQIASGGVFSSSEHRRFYYFSIDDGDQQYDNYLTTDNYKTHTYNASYDGVGIGGNFTADSDYKFRIDYDRVGGPVAISNYTISEIKITQNITSVAANVISYKNINF